MAGKTETAERGARILVRPPQGIPSKMMAGYLSRCGSGAGALTAIVEGGEFRAVEVFGHRLKGSGGTYGISRLSEIGARIEIAAAQHDSLELRNLAAALDEYLSLLEVEA